MHDAAFSRLFISVRARVKHMQEPGLQLRGGDAPEQLAQVVPSRLRRVSCGLGLGIRVNLVTKITLVARLLVGRGVQL